MGLKIVFKKGFGKMNNNINVITQKEELYDKCENMEELYDKYYLPLLEKHYKKTYILEKALDEIEKIILKATTDEETGKDLGYSDNIPYDDLLEIIQKAKGDVRNENNNI
jgi:spore coat protein CotH